MAKKTPDSRPPRLTLVQGTKRRAPSNSNTPRTTTDQGRLPTRIFFARSGSTPTGASLTTLSRYGDWLARRGSRKVYVLGHANKRGWDKTAIALADERSRAVRDLIIWFGAKPAQVSRITPSELHLMSGVSTRAERQAHRCVDLIVAPDDRLANESQVPRTVLRRTASGGRGAARR